MNKNEIVNPLLFLVGARGSGKSTIGRRLASMLNLPFHDLDEVFSRSENTSIAEFVNGQGWDKFRKRESEYLENIAKSCISGGIIATGGGIVLSVKNRNFMTENGLVVWLNTPVETLRNRLQADLAPMQRPSLTGKSALDEIAQIAKEREELYRNCAHIIVNGDNDEENLCRLIHGRIKNHSSLT